MNAAPDADGPLAAAALAAAGDDEEEPFEFALHRQRRLLRDRGERTHVFEGGGNLSGPGIRA